jgi:hypothetical protein
MQLKWLAIPIISASAVLSYAPTANAITLVLGEEPVMQLVSPIPGGSPMKYAQVNGTGPVISEPITATPLLCRSVRSTTARMV